MPGALENGLRRCMEGLGHAVEAVIGKAREARVQVGTRGGTQPILSLEGQLAPGRIRELIEAAIQKTMANAIPALNGGAALEIGEGPVSYGQKMLSSQAGIAIGAEIGGGSVGRQGDLSRGFVIRGDVTRLPFGNAKFAYVLARMATTFQGDMTRATRELGRIMAGGGQGVIVDYHPFGLYSRRGMNRARPPDSGVHKLEDYYRICRQAGLRVVDVREVFIDEVMRPLFKEEEISVYRNLKGTPLLIFAFVYKPKGTT